MEETLVNFLQDDDTSFDGILQLEPMNSYNRLLLHHLAEIFGPPILVSDILWEYAEPRSLVTSHQILRRKEASPVSRENTAPIPQSLDERKAAYLLARERIFSMHLEEVKEPGEEKPPSVSVVACRMIPHALGQKIHMNNQNGLVSDSIKDSVFTDELNAQDKNSEESNIVKNVRTNSTSRIGNPSSSNAALLNKRNHQIPTEKYLPQNSQDGK